MGQRSIQGGTVIPGVGTEEEQTPMPPLRVVAHLGDDFHRGNVMSVRRKHTTTYRPIAREAADRLPRGRRGQRNGLVYHAGYEGFDPESWQVIVKAHESVRLELAPPVHGALQTVVLILRSPTTCYKELIATTSTTLARPRDRGARIRGSCARTMARVGWDNPIVRCVCVHDQ